MPHQDALSCHHAAFDYHRPVPVPSCLGRLTVNYLPRSLIALFAWIVTAIAYPAAGQSICRFEIIDAETKWPVPLVELRTVSGLRYVSDNAGIIAFDALECMNQPTWFDVIGHGYGVKTDGFGYSGVRLTPVPGQTLRVPVERQAIAKRIGRLTGSGLFAELDQCTQDQPHAESGIVGCDSIQNAIYRDRLYWFWGDTLRANYPLGIFQSTGATSLIPRAEALKPPLNLTLDYFRDEQQRPRGVCQVPGKGPTWITAVCTVLDQHQQPHLVATYAKIEPPLGVWQRGLLEWNDKTQHFDVLKILWDKSSGTPAPKLFPDGHAVPYTDPESDNTSWLLFGNPLPTLKVKASFEAWQDPDQWQAVDSPKEFKPVASSKQTKPVKIHTGHMAWNDCRQRWVTVFLEAYGQPSALGELWYAESRSPFGPWGPAIKILTHQNYTFYNPRLHPEFVQSNTQSPWLFFEGTYTTMFANTTRQNTLTPDYPHATPRHEYNQILYRLDLDDPRLSEAHQP